jgi:hypothetical protein
MSNSPVILKKKCLECGESFETFDFEKVFCDLQCKAANQKKRALERKLASKKKLNDYLISRGCKPVE